MFKVVLFFATLGASSPLLAYTGAGDLIKGSIPEVGFQIQPCSYFFGLKNPREFEIARPESFEDMSRFKTIDLSYSIDEQLSIVWSKYLVINPLKIWSTSRSMVRAVFVPSLNRTLYRDDLEQDWTGFEEGMKFFVDMASLPVAVTNKPAMMVALEIIRIDSENRQVVFRYLEGTPSYGEQVIEFRESDESPAVTSISHKTWFRSYGSIIEALYPMYHRKMISGMHARFKWEIEGESAP